MKTVLQINASLFSNQGQSSRLADEYVAALAARHPGLEVIRRDLAREPVPHLDAERFGAFLAKPQERSDAQQAVVAYSDALIDELRRADEIALGLPMYNFGVPSQLKAWIDHIARAGQTFRYTENGSEGLLKGKKAIVFAARGGLYSGTPRDTQTPYVRDFLAFVGIAEVTFVYAEGLAINEASKQSAIARARGEIELLAPALQAAA